MRVYTACEGLKPSEAHNGLPLAKHRLIVFFLARNWIQKLSEPPSLNSDAFISHMACQRASHFAPWPEGRANIGSRNCPC